MPLAIFKIHVCGKKGKMRYDLFEMSVTVPSTSPDRSSKYKIPEYGLNNLTFVEGRKGQSFSLKLRNDSARRVMAVISIDGLSVIDGIPCTDQSRGYIIHAYSTVEVQGWRTSLSEVRAFKFESKEKSLVQGTTGENKNCGVIAAKFFSEKFTAPPITKIEHHHHHSYPMSGAWYKPQYLKLTDSCTATSSMSSVADSCTDNPIVIDSAAAVEVLQVNTTSNVGLGTSQPTATLNIADGRAHSNVVPNFNLGVGCGESKADSVTQTSFDTDREICTLTIYYAEAADLELAGVQLTKTPAIALTPVTPELPQAFSGFCKIPAGM